MASGLWHITIIAAAGALALATPARAADFEDAPRATASNGVVVVMPEIESLTCPQMAHVLHRIDLSRYRGPATLPKGHPDWPIFDYEDRLARHHYYNCTMRAHRLEDPSTAFSFGFYSQ